MRLLSRVSLGLFVLALLASVSTGQQVSDPIPLHNWAAPAFWSPSPNRQVPAENHRGLSIERATAAAATPAYAFVATSPCRQYNSLNFTPLLQGVNRVVTLTGVPCGIPVGTVAVSANITVFNITGAIGNAVFKVDTVSPPLSAWINYPPTEAQRGNAGVAVLNGSGQIVVQVAQGGGQVDLVVDVNGYYTSVGIVSSLNGLDGNVTLSPGTDLSLGSVGQVLTLSANSASANTADTLVRRDGAGNFSAGTITANLTGTASLNVRKAGDVMTGDLAFFPGNLFLTESSGASGNIFKGGTPFIHNFGSFSTFIGEYAGNFTMTGGGNTAVGWMALWNTQAGSGNTATGTQALSGNMSGNLNTANGYGALGNNDSGNGNTANGVQALQTNSSGNYNTASGYTALSRNMSGGFNTALGESALFYNSTGSRNVALGYQAGFNLTTGNDNIDIVNEGVAAESGTIRIGDPVLQTLTFIAGIVGATSASGVPVLIDSNGQLGTTPSSARFKDNIRDMGEESQGLLRLRPVSFRYKPELDPMGLEQYGLVAEEVAEVYPDLVTCDDAGQPQAVRYHFLVPMLLNEVQRDRKTIEEQRLAMEAHRLRVQKLEDRLERLEALFSASAR